jgi:hypothetical protein
LTERIDQIIASNEKFWKEMEKLDAGDYAPVLHEHISQVGHGRTSVPNIDRNHLVVDKISICRQC